MSAKNTLGSKLWKAIFEATKSPICVFDTEYKLIAFNQAHSDEFYRIYEYRVQIGDEFPNLFLPEQRDTMRSFMARALAGESYIVTEEFGDPNLDMPYWEIIYTPIRDEHGKVIAAFHHAQDISDRLRAQAILVQSEAELRKTQALEAHKAHLETVLREMTHRSKNLLAVVQSVAQQTAKSAVDNKDFNNRFGARLRALADSHDLIAKAEWQGISVKDMMDRQLGHLLGSYPGRITLSGDEYGLPPDFAQYLGLALHELGTNAVKYGALKNEDGQIVVHWSRSEDDGFSIDWKEIGGCSEVPLDSGRKGFGRTLIEAIVPQSVGGTATVEFTPGLHWTLKVP